MDDSYIPVEDNVHDNQFRFSFPIHKKIKQFEFGKFYCAEHLPEDNLLPQRLDWINGPDIASYISSFLGIKKF